MNTVGSSINGVGDSINSSIRYYGDGAKDYGNSIMDWSSASAPRAQTASNPLGLSGSVAGGKTGTTNPSMYRAAPTTKKKVQDNKQVQKKVVAAPKPSVPVAAANNKPKPKVEPTKKVSPLKAGSSPAAVKTTAVPKTVVSSKPAVSKPTVSKPGPVAVKSGVSAKSVPASTVKSKPTAVKNNPAANPLGLKF